MLLLKKPTDRQVQDFLEQQAPTELTYQGIGLTATQPPAGYRVDHTRVSLGHGERAFAAARRALEQWRQFHIGWLETWPANAPIQDGQVVVIVAQSVGLWWLNACRIVYSIDEPGGAHVGQGDKPAGRRFGFAYGTLSDHAGTGEERFLVEMDEEGEVWYDILAFSRPRHPLARLGYPLVRAVQKQFGRDSAAAMRRVVDGEVTERGV
jgi:uncharacterized protein (UPF0548 family)